MAQPIPTNDRLPWLTEVPRIGAQPPAAKRKWQFPWGAVLIGLAFAFVAVAAYYLGIRRAVEADDARPGPSMPLEQPYEEPVADAAPPAEEEAALEEVANVAEPAPTARRTAAIQRPRQARPVRPEPNPDAPSETTADETLPAPVIVQPVVRGRIIQLGAYPTRGQAELAWQQLVKKWPYLATKPKLVSPIEVRSTDGKGTRMHRLQLATSSQAQSAVICQQLAKTRQSCVVVY
jgi:hypothetical protein